MLLVCFHLRVYSMLKIKTMQIFLDGVYVHHTYMYKFIEICMCDEIRIFSVHVA